MVVTNSCVRGGIGTINASAGTKVTDHIGFCQILWQITPVPYRIMMENGKKMLAGNVSQINLRQVQAPSVIDTFQDLSLFHTILNIPL